MDPELRALREEAVRRHRAATRKVSRLKSNNNVMVSGTAVDPRRSRSNIKRYTRLQLRTYINELNEFTNRRTQFVPDASQRPMRRSAWQTYRNLEQQYNRRLEQRFNRVKNIDLPSSGMTVGERAEMMRAPHPQMVDRAVNTPQAVPRRDPSNMTSEKALARLTRDMRQRLKPSYLDGLTRAGREQYQKMSNTINQPELDRKVARLTDAQFDVLWNYTNFATAESLHYQMTQAMLSDKERPWHSQVAENAMENAHELADWAATLDLDG